MLYWAMVAVRPLEGLRIRLTFPLNPFSAVTVTTELPGAPARVVIVEGLAVTAKSTTWTITVMVCVRVALELMIVAV